MNKVLLCRLLIVGNVLHIGHCHMVMVGSYSKNALQGLSV